MRGRPPIRLLAATIAAFVGSLVLGLGAQQYFPPGSGAGVDGALSSLALGATPALIGAIRLTNGTAINVRNNANTGDSSVFTYGSVATDAARFGGGYNTRIRSDLAVPATLAQGDWWVECTGTSPARICAIKVFDASATRVIATMTY